MAKSSSPQTGNEYELANLRSHERHMQHIYGLRWAALGLSAVAICVGAVMVFMGLQGSFNWAVEAPLSIGAKLTNASPGIVFATVGLIIGFCVVLQKPVSYRTPSANKDDEIGFMIREGLAADFDRTPRRRRPAATQDHVHSRRVPPSQGRS